MSIKEKAHTNPKKELILSALPRIVTVPDTTALWFEQQLAIEKGELSVDEFLDEIEKFVGEQIEAAKNVKLEVKGEPCSCGQGVLVLKIQR